MRTRKLEPHEAPPYDLLLLADPSRLLIETYLADGDCYNVEEKGEIIGVFVVVELHKETIEIKNIAVREDLQCQGIGKKLVIAAIRIAKENGYATVEIGTGNSSIGQLALYQKCGFRITGVIQDFFVDQYDEIIMENGIQCIDMIRLEMNIKKEGM